MEIEVVVQEETMYRLDRDPIRILYVRTCT